MDLALGWFARADQQPQSVYNNKESRHWGIILSSRWDCGWTMASLRPYIALRAASSVLSMSSGEWASDRKPASNGEGAV